MNEYLTRSPLYDPDRAESRLQDVSDALTTLIRYERLLRDLGEIDLSKIDNAGGLGRGLADRAYEAERAGRVVLAGALDTLNDLRDAGTLYPLCADAAKRLGSITPEDISVRLEQAQKQAGSIHPAFAEAFTQAGTFVTQLGLSWSLDDDDTVTLTCKPIIPGETASLSMSLHPKPGQSARVSSEQLFATGVKNTVHGARQLYTPMDCHHNPLHASLDRVDNHTTDIYTAALGGIAATMALFYQHARRTDELGPRALRAADPLTFLLGAIFVVGAALFIYGFVVGNIDFILWGAGLMIGAGLVYFFGFDLVLVLFCAA